MEDEAHNPIDVSIPVVEVDSGLLHQDLKNLFTEEVVYDRLSKFDSGKSAGPDGLHPHLWKECASSIAKPFASIFQESSSQDDWKLANVCPIFKKGSRNLVSYYRPVSLTSVACKVVEQVIKRVLSEFANVNHLVTDYQHGFRGGRSCLINLLESFELWTEALDCGYGLHTVLGLSKSH